MTFTRRQLEQLQQEGKIRGFTECESKQEAKPAARRSKYGSEKVVIDGITFDSMREGKRYMQLRYLLMAGQITDLIRQIDFELNPGGTHSLKYRADFVYKELPSGNVVVEDCKGFRTKEYKKKRRLMLEVHGIEIVET
jgi:hypothetical protein